MQARGVGLRSPHDVRDDLGRVRLGEGLDELATALGGRTEIELARLRELAPALQRLVVQRMADDAIGRPAAGVARRADEIAALSHHGTAAIDLPHGVRATATDGVLRFGPTPPREPRPATPID